jgi:hypothetical protein
MPMNKGRFSPTRLLVGISLCVGSVASFPMPAAAACQAGEPGCVLPVDRAPPFVQRTTPPPVVVDERGGFGLGWIALLAALAAIAALLLFVLDDDDDDVPVSP